MLHHQKVIFGTLKIQILKSRETSSSAKANGDGFFALNIKTAYFKENLKPTRH